jgi:hypothetical protein
MTKEFDFEIDASLRARELRIRALRDDRIEPEGDPVELDRQESRTTLPSELRAGETYEDVEIAKRVRGRLRRTQ